MNSGPSRALHMLHCLELPALPGTAQQSLLALSAFLAVISGDSLTRPVKMHCTGRWFPLPGPEPLATLSVQAAGKERCPPHPQVCALRLSLSFTPSFFTHTACFLRGGYHAGSGGLPHGLVKKLCYDPRFTRGNPGTEGAALCSRLHGKEVPGGRGPGVPALHLLPPRRAPPELRSPLVHTCASSTFQPPLGQPQVAQRSGGLTQPVAGVPFEERSQQTLGLHAEELRHA